VRSTWQTVSQAFPFHTFRLHCRHNFEASTRDIESSPVATHCACCLFITAERV
jgi:hypothetical protein